MTSNIRGPSICSQKSLYKKTSHEILGELKAAFKTGASKVSRTRPVLPSLLRPTCQACVNSQLSLTPAVATKRKGEEEERNKTNFSSCNDRNPKWIINNYYIFFPNLWVWVFLFLRTPFFKTQHVGPMLHSEFFLLRVRKCFSENHKIVLDKLKMEIFFTKNKKFQKRKKKVSAR